MKSFFQLNPPLRVGEILLCNMKSSLRSGEIAAAVGGFNFICGKAEDFIQATLGFHRALARFHYHTLATNYGTNKLKVILFPSNNHPTGNFYACVACRL